MHPILFEINGFAVYSFGLMMASAFLVANLWMTWRAKQAGENEQLYFESTLWIIVSGILGAKLFYFIFFPHIFFADPIGALVSQGGLVWYGGLITATAAIIVYCKLKNINIWTFGDILTPPAALGVAIGRIGCFLSGCCFGGGCNLPWAVQYPFGHETHPHLVHPSPLYETFAMVIATGLLLWIDKHKQFKGVTTGGFFVLYGIIRFVLEYYRGDRLVWIEALNLSASQCISLAGVIGGALTVYILKKQHEKTAYSAD